MAGDLWIYGGLSSDVWLSENITAPHTGADCHLMKTLTSGSLSVHLKESPGRAPIIQLVSGWQPACFC